MLLGDIDMDKCWSDIYSKPVDIKDFIENVTIHKDFICQMVEMNHSKVIEVGCGSGTLSVFMSHLGSDVTAVDLNSEVLANAQKTSANLGGNIKFRKADAFNLPFKDKEFDLAFSQGVLEHFTNNEIVLILREQLRIAKHVFFSVPNNYYNHRDFGDERLMSRKMWEQIISEFSIIISNNYYPIRAKRNFMICFPIMYMAGIK